jgi:hypothetical protein
MIKLGIVTIKKQLKTHERALEFSDKKLQKTINPFFETKTRNRFRKLEFRCVAPALIYLEF